MSVETLEDRCLLSTMLGAPLIQSVASDHYSDKDATARLAGAEHEKLGPTVRNWTPGITGHELVEKIRVFKQYWKDARGEDDGGKPTPPPVVTPPETSSPPKTPPGSNRPQPSPVSEIEDPGTPAGKPQTEGRSAAQGSTFPAAQDPSLLVAANALRPVLSGGGDSDLTGGPVLDVPLGPALALGSTPEGGLGTARTGNAEDEPGAVLPPAPGEQAHHEAQAAAAGLDALAFVALADGFNGATFAPQGEEELAELSLFGESAQPGLIGRAFEQLTDWLNTDAVRSTLPWLTAGAVAALAGEIARRQLRPARRPQLALPPWPSGGGCPPEGCGEGATP